MRKSFIASMVLALFVLSAFPVMAGKAEEFKKIKILDDILVFVDVDDDALKADQLKGYAIDSFVRHMRGMLVNNDAVVDNYPAQGYELENVGYIIMKVMSIRTEAGLNVYHLGFEFGIPPREVYWDTATMGVAPTSLKLKKEVYEDVDEVMKEFADAFYGIRGE